MAAPSVNQLVNYYANGSTGPKNHSTDPLPAIITGVYDSTHVYLAIFGYRGDGPYRKTLIYYGGTRPSGTPYCLAQTDDAEVDVGHLALAEGSVVIGNSSGAGSALSAKGDGKVLVGNGTTAVSVSISGDATLASTGALTLASSVKPMVLPLTSARKVAAIKDVLPDAGDATSLGLADAEGSILVGTTTNGGGTASVSETCLFNIALPQDYVAGQAVTLRVRAKVSAARQVSATIDATAKVVGDTLGADIVGTAAQAMTTDFANYDFTITPTGLVAGSVLSIVITAAADDTAGSTDGAISVSQVSLRPTIKG